jgi:hypothetical protein
MERHRWQEQSVMAFIWLLFTDVEQMWNMSTTLDFWHEKHVPSVVYGM